MKKIVLVAALLMATIGLKAQTNIQEMWDYNRAQFTTTLEMFKADNWGSTFFFVDIYHKTDQTTPTDFYTEIARALNFWKDSKLGALSLHVEWNGGCGIYSTPGYDSWGGYQVKNAWLFGVEYFLHNADFTNTFTFELMYKRISGQKALDDAPALMRYFDKVSDFPIQFTFVWGMQNLFNVKGLTFSGFLDIWGENNNWGLTNDLKLDNTQWVILSEPQIWYNVGQHFGCENLNIGGEVELAYNFTGGYKPLTATFINGNKGFTAAPCLGIKWNF